VATTTPPAIDEAATPGGVFAQAEAEAATARGTGDMIKARMPSMVKGAGFSQPGGNTPLTDQADIATRVHTATMALRTETWRGYNTRQDVVNKGFNQGFLNQFGRLKSALSMPSIGDQIAQLVGGMPGGADALKSFTAGNLGLAGMTSGLVPFDLAAPSRLIYPVYTVFRNKLPRPQGQGTMRQEKVITGISGSQTGGQGVVDISVPELVMAAGTMASAQWPMNLPGTGSQTKVDINVPYRFFGLTESLSWLAQFAGQGFEDISALANLVLLQEMMLGEEYMMLAGTAAPIQAPTLVSATVRNAGANETALVFAAADISICVTGTNYYGETVASNVITVTTATTTVSVVDLVVTLPPGALQYNVYAVTNAAPQLSTGTTIFARNIGGSRYTMQGAVSAANTTPPPVADSGTGATTRMEGIIPTLTGQSAAVGVYPATWQGGYTNQAVGTHLSVNAVYTALDALWESSTGSVTPGAFRADPAELVGDGGDIMRLSNDVISAGSATTYRLFIEQPDVSGVKVGAAVSEFQNPITRSILKLVVHPWLTQGTALLMSYQLPQTWTNVANAWEMTCVQDYASIAWPVIDASFRFSIFLYGALVASAPFYSGILQGLQVSDTTPFS
jgi:hypothetical protein